MSRSSTDAVLAPAFIIMAGRVLGFIAAFAIPVVLTRVFTQEDFGTYKQLFLVYSTLFIIMQMGMAESLYYFLPDAGKEAGKLVVNAALSLLVLGLATFGGLWLFRDAIGQLMTNDAVAAWLPWIGVYLFFMIGAVLLEIVLTNRRSHVGASAAYALTDVSRLILYILPVLLFGGLEAVLGGAIAFAILRFGVMAVYLFREFRHALAPDAAVMKKQLAYALPFGIATVLEVAQLNYHQFAVSHYFDAATYAIYAIGCLQIPVTDFLMTSTSNVMMVSMREQLRRNRLSRVVELWRNTTRKLMIVFCLMVGGLLVIAEELIVLLFTEQYAASVPIFMVWSAAMILPAFLTDSVLRVFAQTRFLIALNAIKLVVIASCIGFFLNEWGLMGAVAVTVFGALVSKTVAIVRVRYLLQTTWRELLPWRSILSVLLMAAAAMAVVLGLKSVLQMGDLARLLIAGSAWTAIFGTLIVLFGPLEREEKMMLYNCLRSPRSILG